jgi:hypothetical protein
VQTAQKNCLLLFFPVCPWPDPSFPQKRWMSPRHIFGQTLCTFLACNGHFFLSAHLLSQHVQTHFGAAQEQFGSVLWLGSTKMCLDMLAKQMGTQEKRKIWYFLYFLQ